MKKMFKLSGMHCTSCALNVEWVLEDMGLKAKCSYISQTVEVESLQDFPENEIKEAMEKEGFTVTSE